MTAPRPKARLAPNRFRVGNRLRPREVAVIHAFLRDESTWARGIPAATLRRALAHSLCFVGRLDGRLVAFARVVTDRATFANLVDVFVLPGQRGRGWSQRLLAAVVAHRALQGLRRFTLATSDAHRLYARFGFAPLAEPHTYMERHDPAVYGRGIPPTPAAR